MSQKYARASELDRMEKMIAKVKGTYILPPEAGALEKAKYEVCRRILVFMHERDLSQRQLAGYMGIPETRVSEVVHYRIEKFTFDKLIFYYQKLNPKVSISVA